MNVLDGIKTGLKGLGICVGGVVTVVVVIPVACVSLIALSFHGIHALYEKHLYDNAYQQTLSQGRRALFGRVEGQDYTRWDGKTSADLSDLSEREIAMIPLLHKIGLHFHHRSAGQDRVESTFTTQEDIDWLKREYEYREAKEALDNDLIGLRAFAKTLIPLLGLVWAYHTETTPVGGAFPLGSKTYYLGISNEKVSHWSVLLRHHLEQAREATTHNSLDYEEGFPS